MNDEQWQAMLNAQCTWDATMGLHAVQPIQKDADPKAIMVVLVGSGHVQYGLGIERQVKPSFSGKVASIIPVSVADEKKGPVRSVQASYASFVWGTPPETDPVYPEPGISTRVRPEDRRLEIIDVEKDTPAEAGGLKVGDVLLSMDGAPIPDREAFAKAMAGKRWGDAASISVRRGEETIPVTVLLRRAAPSP
jgi:membrane-associated protease RseP (regulator of RpoE activity)